MSEEKKVPLPPPPAEIAPSDEEIDYPSKIGRGDQSGDSYEHDQGADPGAGQPYGGGNDISGVGIDSGGDSDG